MPLLKTYTFYLYCPDGREAFEPGLCADHGAAMERARALLASRPECAAVEIHLGEEMLFRVERPETAPVSGRPTAPPRR